MSKRKLRVVAEPSKPVELVAPPILDAYGSLEFLCGGCDTRCRLDHFASAVDKTPTDLVGV
jgi:hypothetical protein